MKIFKSQISIYLLGGLLIYFLVLFFPHAAGPYHPAAFAEIINRNTLITRLAISACIFLVSLILILTKLRAKKAAVELKKHQDEFHNLFNNMINGVALNELIFDKEGNPIDYRFLQVNKTIEKQTSIKAADFIGHTAKELFPETESYWIETAAQVIRTGQSIRIEKYSHAVGRYFEVIFYRTEGNRFVTVAEDTTLRRHAVEAISNKEKELQAIFDATSSGLLLVDKKTRILNVNPALEHALEVTRGELIGTSFLDLVSLENRADSQASFQKVLNGEGVEESEVLAKSKSGEQLTFLLNQQPLLDETGRISKVVISATDITKSKNTEKMLMLEKMRAESASRTKSDFLTTMSHELRTPMNGVIGMSQLLKHTKIDKEQREYLDIILASSRALLDILNSLLDLASIECGKTTLSSGPVNLHDIAANMLDLLHPLAGEKRIQLSLVYDPKLPVEFIADADRLRQILLNLLSNGIKFTNEGSVTLTISEETPAITRIEISDTGIGIPEDKLELIFEKFTQVDQSNTRKYEGTGLGLNITKRLVELMQGTITCQSSVSEGSTFTILLPLKKTAPASSDLS
jgi:PAS domain S-box-containing protein